MLRAVEQADGTIQIEGHDLGSGVADFWGSGLTEYEWTWTIQPENVARAVEALGGSAADEPTAQLHSWFDRHRSDPGQAIKDAGVPIDFWSRVGD